MLPRILLTLLIIFSPLVKAETGRAYLMTTSDSVNESELHIVNTSLTAQLFTGTLYSNAGDSVGAENVSLHSEAIAPNGRLVLTSSDVEKILGIAPWSGPAMMEIFGPDEFRVMVKLRSLSGFVSNSNCITRNSVNNVEGQEQTDRTFVRFINIGTTEITNIRGSLYDQNGDIIGEENQVLFSSLSPKQQIWLNNNRLKDIFGVWDGPASLNVPGYDKLRLLNLNYVNSETFFNFSCVDQGGLTDSSLPSGSFEDAVSVIPGQSWPPSSCPGWTFLPQRASYAFSSSGSPSFTTNSFQDGRCEYSGAAQVDGTYSGTMRCGNEYFDEGTWSTNKIQNSDTNSFFMEFDVILSNRSCSYTVRAVGVR